MESLISNYVNLNFKNLQVSPLPHSPRQPRVPFSRDIFWHRSPEFITQAICELLRHWRTPGRNIDPRETGLRQPSSPLEVTSKHLRNGLDHHGSPLGRHLQLCESSWMCELLPHGDSSTYTHKLSPQQ